MPTTQKTVSILAKCTIDFETPKPRQILYISPQQLNRAQRFCEAICNGVEAGGKIAGGLLSIISVWWKQNTRWQEFWQLR